MKRQNFPAGTLWSAHARLELMNGPVARFVSSRRYFVIAAFALAGSGICAAAAVRWPAMLIPAFITTGVTAVLGGLLLLLALRPAVEIHESRLMIGRRAIPWTDIRRVDQTGWSAPLAVYLTLDEDKRVLLVHAGEPASAGALLRYIRRYSRRALIDGVPYARFWGDGPSPAQHLPPSRYPLLRPEDEDEIERMFQRLKTAGYLDRTESDRK